MSCMQAVVESKEINMQNVTEHAHRCTSMLNMAASCVFTQLGLLIADKSSADCGCRMTATF